MMLCAIPHVSLAQDLNCRGANPAWSLSTDEETGSFSFERTSDMQIMQDDTAQNDDTVRAMTLVGPRDSAIVIIDQTTNRATVLTQRGQTPIILSGACDQY